MKKLKIKIRSKLIGYTLGIIAAFALSLTGCGEVNEQTEVVKPEIESLEDVANETAELASSTAVKDYYKNVTDEQLKEYAAEALRNKGFEPKLAENRIMTFGITFDIPEGFEPDVEHDNMWVTKRYPIEASNIIYAELDPDYTMLLMEEDYFEQVLVKAFAQNNANDVAVDITKFESIEIDGIPAFRIEAKYDIGDTHMSHLIIAINGSKTYVVVYTQTDEYNRSELFEASAASISVKK